jgi:arsenite/tail-anchored protein-transporting ATPase
MRIIVYTGKGGVGKTSVAAATGVCLAGRGRRTLVLSTDAAHSLADSFDRPLGPEPVVVADNLWGQEVDCLREAERSWGAVQKWMSRVLHWAQVADINSEEVLVFPGFEEVFSLLQILEHARSQNFEVLVVDCAPTGETLRLLSYPNVIRWWLNKVFPFQRRIAKVMRPVAKLVTGGLELPSEDALDSIDLLFHQVEEMNRLLLDPVLTSVRVVLNPEKMVLAEARRSFTYLNLYGFNTDAVIVNRVLPASAGNDCFSGWRSIQAKYEEEIRAAFSPLPILHVPWMETEVVGLAMLERVAASAFTEVDPAAVLHTGRVEEVRCEGGEYFLDLAVPFAARGDIHLSQRGDELTIQVGPFKRKTLLPRVLAGRPVGSARFVEQRLHIRFGERPKVVALGEK